MRVEGTTDDPRRSDAAVVALGTPRPALPVPAAGVAMTMADV
ncbi:MULTISPECIES: hypothetical protein [unclassified Streptomyces]